MKIPKIVGFLILMAILYGIGYLFPVTIVLSKAGFLEPDVADQLAIYSDIILFGFAMILLYGVNYFWKKNDKYGDNIGIYNKEETVFKDFTYPQITILSLIFFNSFFLIANLFQFLGKGFFGLRFLGQQFSPVDSLLVSTAQIPIAENFMAGFTIGLICLIMTFIAIKYDLKPRDYKIYKYLAVVVGLAIFGYIWHLTAYPNSDIAGLIVAIFWGLGGYLSILTGFFVVFLIMHMTNNFYIDFSRLYSSDFVLGTSIFIIIALVVFYIYYYRRRWFPLKFK